MLDVVLILDVLIFRVEEHIFYMNYLIARKKSPFKEKRDKKNEKKKTRDAGSPSKLL